MAGDSMELVSSVQRLTVTIGYGCCRCTRDGSAVVTRGGDVKGVDLGWAKCGWIAGGDIDRSISIWCMEWAKGDSVRSVDISW